MRRKISLNYDFISIRAGVDFKNRRFRNIKVNTKLLVYSDF